jgi:serine/threonine-protein kinase
MVDRRSHSRCNSARLKSLLAGTLTRDEEIALDVHLEACDSCRAELESMAASPRLWGEVPRFLGADPDSQETTPWPEVRLRSAQSRPVGGAGAGLDDDAAILRFLDPPDTPDSLGRLGPYRVSGVLGKGGMGIVLKAFDPGLNRPVAIKMLAPELATSGAARQRFKREAVSAAAVVHEHVIAIHAVDVWKGLPYLVMQQVTGRSLQQRLDQDGPLHLKEILRIGMQTAQGLAAAHAQGLVHRDIKPSNILLENGVERVKITDFGLARAVDDASLTQSGVVAGTPQYMAPEQARGEAVDSRSDLFSLGSVLYAMCAGHAPFRAESTLAVLRRVGEDRARPIRDVNPDIPRWFARIIERLHAKKPDGRYQSAGQVADLLARHLAELQHAAQEPELGDHVAKKDPPSPAEANRKARGALFVMIALAIVLIGKTKPDQLARFKRAVTAVFARDRAEKEQAVDRNVVPNAPPQTPNPRHPDVVPHVAPSLESTAVRRTVRDEEVRTLKGVVRARDTGEPLKGVRVSLPGSSGVKVTTAYGQFEVCGTSNARHAANPDTTPFVLLAEPSDAFHFAVMRYVQHPLPKANGDWIDADIKVSKGIPFRVRLTDGAAGTPVRHAKVIYWPLRPNPNVDQAAPNGYDYLHSVATESENGTYSGVLLPGPGAICVESYVDYYGACSIDPVSFFDPARVAPKLIDESLQYGTRQLLAIERGSGRGLYLRPQDGMSSITLINPSTDTATIEQTIVLKKNNREKTR